MLPGRTTSTDVAGIIEVDPSIVGTSLSGLAPFIDIANEMVTERCTQQGQGYDAYRLEMIERWLAAHYYAIRDPRPQSERVGPVSETFQRILDQGLNGTTYGQTALRLDTKGGLQATENKMKYVRDLPIGIMYLGRPSGRLTRAEQGAPSSDWP
jgi:hypothetical protein